MPGSNSQTPPITHVQVSTLAERNSYPESLRTWGMQITVYADPNADNNQTYALVYAKSSTDKTDNNNWSPAGYTQVKGSYTESFSVVLETFEGASAAAVVPIASIAQYQSVTVKINWTAKSSTANQGAAGEYLCNWTKQGGTWVRSFENDTRKGGNMPTPPAITTSVSLETISASLSGASSTVFVAWTAEVLARKV